MNQGDSPKRVAPVATERGTQVAEVTARPEDLSLSRRLAYGILRLSLGLNMFIHGAGRIHTGVHDFVSRAEKLFVDNVLPMSLVHLFLTTLPAIEAAVGFLLIFGLWTRWALTAEGLVLTALLFGTALRADFVAANANTPSAVGLVSQQMVYLLTFYALLAMIHDNYFSLDTLLARRRRN